MSDSTAHREGHDSFADVVDHAAGTSGSSIPGISRLAGPLSAAISGPLSTPPVAPSAARRRSRPRLSTRHLLWILLAVDIVAGLIAILVAATVLPESPGLLALGGCALLWLIAAGCTGAISGDRVRALSPAAVGRVMLAMMALVMIASALSPAVSARLGLVTLSIIALQALAGRVAIRRMLPVRAVIVTEDPGALRVPWPAGETAICRYVVTDPCPSVDGRMVEEIGRAVTEHDAHIVRIADSSHISDTDVRQLAWELRDRDISIRKEIYSAAVHPRRVRATPSHAGCDLEIASARPPLIRRIAKRIVDAVGALTILVALSPLLTVLALLVVADGRGNILYRQERVGRNGQRFKIIKFRSMKPDADAELESLLLASSSGDVPLFKVDDDPRITRLGAVMRRYSLDELPQLFNVVAGSMSLVGPRPQRPGEVALYDRESFQRLGVTPGMTGLWQVSGRSRLTWPQALELDIYYAHNWSLWMDACILARTFRAVIGGDGAQ